MNTNKIKLKIKSKSLAEEAKIIRKEEQKLLSSFRYTNCTDSSYLSGYESIRGHRTSVVRWEARATHLALALLNNKPYISVEKSRKPEKEWDFNVKVLPAVVRMFRKYGGKIDVPEVPRISGESCRDYLKREDKLITQAYVDYVNDWIGI